jgi:hypothetical protein
VYHVLHKQKSALGGASFAIGREIVSHKGRWMAEEGGLATMASKYKSVMYGVALSVFVSTNIVHRACSCGTSCTWGFISDRKSTDAWLLWPRSNGQNHKWDRKRSWVGLCLQSLFVPNTTYLLWDINSPAFFPAPLANCPIRYSWAPRTSLSVFLNQINFIEDAKTLQSVHFCQQDF